MLIEAGKGGDILKKLTLTARLQAAVLNVTQMKKILNFLIQQSINTELSKEKLAYVDACSTFSRFLQTHFIFLISVNYPQSKMAWAMLHVPSMLPRV